MKINSKNFKFTFILEPEFPINSYILATEALRIANQYHMQKIFLIQLISEKGKRVRSSNGMWFETDGSLDEIYKPEELLKILPESDYVAVCCQWTPETEKLISYEAFGAMKRDAVIVNIARGEIIDEEALVRALNENKLRGAVLDVYRGEFERMPDPRLWNDNRVLITPHISAASDVNTHRGNELFLKNLKRYLANEPLENIIDWDKGY